MENPQHALIEQYLDGTLPPDERAAVEAQLTTDPALATELRLHEAARAAVEVQAMLDRRDRIQRRGKKMLFWKKWHWQIQDALEAVFVQKRDDSPGRLRWGLIGGLSLATAALVLYLINPGLFFPETNQSTGPMVITREQAAEAYDTYFQRLDLRNTLGASDTDTLFQRAQNLYTAGNCTAALQTLEALLNDQTFERRPMALLLKGTCQLDQGQAEAALETLRQVPPAAAGLHQDAQWYIALAYLKLERTDDAGSLLRTIADDARHRHGAEAQRLLQIGK
ncbi:MAG: tetratricopeptide repeat protein [Saprospiraceae bacterium]|nr:tetratricopeptide repeat protein [Lewinellaceae bacterium]